MQTLTASTKKNVLKQPSQTIDEEFGLTQIKPRRQFDVSLTQPVDDSSVDPKKEQKSTLTQPTKEDLIDFGLSQIGTRKGQQTTITASLLQPKDDDVISIKGMPHDKSKYKTKAKTKNTQKTGNDFFTAATQKLIPFGQFTTNLVGRQLVLLHNYTNVNIGDVEALSFEAFYQRTPEYLRPTQKYSLLKLDEAFEALGQRFEDRLEQEQTELKDKQMQQTSLLDMLHDRDTVQALSDTTIFALALLHRFAVRDLESILSVKYDGLKGKGLKGYISMKLKEMVKDHAKFFAYTGAALALGGIAWGIWSGGGVYATALLLRNLGFYVLPGIATDLAKELMGRAGLDIVYMKLATAILEIGIIKGKQWNTMMLSEAKRQTLREWYVPEYIVNASMQRTVLQAMRESLQVGATYYMGTGFSYGYAFDVIKRQVVPVAAPGVIAAAIETAKATPAALAEAKQATSFYLKDQVQGMRDAFADMAEMFYQSEQEEKKAASGAPFEGETTLDKANQAMMDALSATYNQTMMDAGNAVIADAFKPVAQALEKKTSPTSPFTPAKPPEEIKTKQGQEKDKEDTKTPVILTSLLQSITQQTETEAKTKINQITQQYVPIADLDYKQRREEFLAELQATQTKVPTRAKVAMDLLNQNKRAVFGLAAAAGVGALYFGGVVNEGTTRELFGVITKTAGLDAWLGQVTTHLTTDKLAELKVLQGKVALLSGKERDGVIKTIFDYVFGRKFFADRDIDKMTDSDLSKALQERNLLPGKEEKQISAKEGKKKLKDWQNKQQDVTMGMVLKNSGKLLNESVVSSLALRAAFKGIFPTYEETLRRAAPYAGLTEDEIAVFNTTPGTNAFFQPMTSAAPIVPSTFITVPDELLQSAVNKINLFLVQNPSALMRLLTQFQSQTARLAALTASATGTATGVAETMAGYATKTASGVWNWFKKTPPPVIPTVGIPAVTGTTAFYGDRLAQYAPYASLTTQEAAAFEQAKTWKMDMLAKELTREELFGSQVEFKEGDFLMQALRKIYAFKNAHELMSAIGDQTGTDNVLASLDISELVDMQLKLADQGPDLAKLMADLTTAATTTATALTKEQLENLKNALDTARKALFRLNVETEVRRMLEGSKGELEALTFTPVLRPLVKLIAKKYGGMITEKIAGMVANQAFAAMAPMLGPGFAPAMAVAVAMDFLQNFRQYADAGVATGDAIASIIDGMGTADKVLRIMDMVLKDIPMQSAPTISAADLAKLSADLGWTDWAQTSVAEGMNGALGYLSSAGLSVGRTGLSAAGTIQDAFGGKVPKPSEIVNVITGATVDSIIADGKEVTAYQAAFDALVNTMTAKERLTFTGDLKGDFIKNLMRQIAGETDIQEWIEKPGAAIIDAAGKAADGIAKGFDQAAEATFTGLGTAVNGIVEGHAAQAVADQSSSWLDWAANYGYD